MTPRDFTEIQPEREDKAHRADHRPAGQAAILPAIFLGPIPPQF